MFSICCTLHVTGTRNRLCGQVCEVLCGFFFCSMITVRRWALKKPTDTSPFSMNIHFPLHRNMVGKKSSFFSVQKIDPFQRISQNSGLILIHRVSGRFLVSGSCNGLVRQVSMLESVSTGGHQLRFQKGQICKAQHDVDGIPSMNLKFRNFRFGWFSNSYRWIFAL